MFIRRLKNIIQFVYRELLPAFTLANMLFYLLGCVAILATTYSFIDKERSYLTGIEFYYGTSSNLKAGDNWVFRGKTYELKEDKERWITIANRRQTKVNTQRFQTLITSKEFIYNLLLKSAFINKEKDLLANQLGPIFFEKYQPISSPNLNTLTIPDYRHLRKLYKKLTKIVSINQAEGIKNTFLLKVETENRKVAELLPEVYYNAIIDFMESKENETLEKNYLKAQYATDSLEKVFQQVNFEESVARDRYELVRVKSIISKLHLTALKKVQRKKANTWSALKHSSQSYEKYALEYFSKESKFTLIDKTIIPIEITKNWKLKWFVFSLTGVFVFILLTLLINFVLQLYDRLSLAIRETAS